MAKLSQSSFAPMPRLTITERTTNVFVDVADLSKTNIFQIVVRIIDKSTGEEALRLATRRSWKAPAGKETNPTAIANARREAETLARGVRAQLYALQARPDIDGVPAILTSEANTILSDETWYSLQGSRNASDPDLTPPSSPEQQLLAQIAAEENAPHMEDGVYVD